MSPTDELESIERLLRELFGDALDLAWAAENVTNVSVNDLTPEEFAQVEKVVPSRQQEYAAGRVCARRALAKLGQEPCAILSSPDRVPQWPGTFVGSISHSNQLCVAAVATKKTYRALGIDVEIARPLSQQLVERVLRAEEKHACSNSDDLSHHANLLFCIKEAVYKCQYPLSQKYLGFSALRIELDPSAPAFRSYFCEAALPFFVADVIEGRYVRSETIVAAFAALPHVQVVG